MTRLLKALTAIVYLLALALGAGGLFVYFSDPEAAGGWPGGALGNPVIPAVAAGWILFEILALGAHRLSGRGRLAGGRGWRPPPAVAADQPVVAAAPEKGSAPAGASRERRVDRLRLEALMRGEQPEPAAFIDRAVALAVESGASDIHLQPGGSECTVTLRMRGEIEPIAVYPIERHGDVVRRLKVLAELPPYVSDSPQDGRLRLETPRGPAEIRLSTVPAQGGERVALRLAGEATRLRLDQLGLTARDAELFERLLAEPQGMIVLTGPTGSGKTTTLYSALDHIHRLRGSRVAIASIEDPIEVELPFVHQVPVHRGRGMEFSKALRSVLRQDPNVLMVGEIRDGETARTAVQAGLSGHLILTTLHSEGTVGVFPRLIDLGTEPFLAASATLACVAQRLVPRLCPHCRHPRTPTAAQQAFVERVRQSVGEPDAGAQFLTAEGCSRCRQLGHVGRVAVFEMLVLSPELRRMIAAREPLDRLWEASRESGRRSLQENAVKLAAAGEISLEEAMSAVSR
ncbi:MAG: GspE/PulE family protein [Acidobacteriota bacterium]